MRSSVLFLTDNTWWIRKRLSHTKTIYIDEYFDELTSNLQTPTLPFTAARCRGVQSSLSMALTSAFPDFTRIWTKRVNTKHYEWIIPNEIKRSLWILIQITQTMIISSTLTWFYMIHQFLFLFIICVFIKFSSLNHNI